MPISKTQQTTKTSHLKKILVSELQQGDLFSFDGKRVFIFSRIKEVIGCGLITIHYLSIKRWASFDKMVRDTNKVFVLPYGRHYEG